MYNIRSQFFQIFEVALVKRNMWLTIVLFLFVTRCLKVYKLFCHISLKLLTSFATNIPLALQVPSYFIILLKAWLYPTCSFLTVPFLYWLHIWQQYIIQHKGEDIESDTNCLVLSSSISSWSGAGNLSKDTNQVGRCHHYTRSYLTPFPYL